MYIMMMLRTCISPVSILLKGKAVTDSPCKDVYIWAFDGSVNCDYLITPSNYGVHKDPEHWCNEYSLTDCCETCATLRAVGFTSYLFSGGQLSLLVYTNLFQFDCETSNCFAYVNHARIRSWNQPVLSNQSKVSCSRKLRGPLMGLVLTTDRYPPITSQTRYQLRQCALTVVIHVIARICIYCVWLDGWASCASINLVQYGWVKHARA